MTQRKFHDLKFIGKSYIQTEGEPMPEAQAKQLADQLELVQRYMTVMTDAVRVHLWYPDVAGNPRYLQVGLMDVRAADDIRVGYDKERDGWVIAQALTQDQPEDDTVHDPDWQEVAFVPAWGRKRPAPAPRSDDAQP